MPDFSKAQVGDRVYSMLHGWGTVGDVYPKSVRVIFGQGSVNIRFMKDGRMEECNHLPVLYWDMPFIKDPPKPKRKVKRELLVWVNVYDRDNQHCLSAYTSSLAAEQNAIPGLRAIAKGVIEWEEEE